MAKYTVRDNESGERITFDWNGIGEPTEADLEEIFASAKSFPITSTEKPQPTPQPKELPPETIGWGAELGRAAVRSGTNVGEMLGNVLRTIGITETGKELTEASRRVEKEYAPGKQYQESFLGRGILGGVQAMGPSLAAGAPGAAIGAVLGPGGALLGGLIGYALGAFGMFTANEYQNYLDEYRKTFGAEPGDETKARAALSGLIEGGFEGISDLIGGGFLLKGVKRAGVLTIKELLKTPMKQAAIKFAETAAVETGTEVTQNALEAYLRQIEGLPTESPARAAVESIIPALTMTGLFNLGHAGIKRVQAASIEKALTDPTMNPMDRINAANYIDTVINESLPENERQAVSDAWKQYVVPKILTDNFDEQGRVAEPSPTWKPQPIDMDFMLDPLGAQADAMAADLSQKLYGDETVINPQQDNEPVKATEIVNKTLDEQNKIETNKTIAYEHSQEVDPYWEMADRPSETAGYRAYWKRLKELGQGQVLKNEPVKATAIVNKALDEQDMIRRDMMYDELSRINEAYQGMKRGEPIIMATGEGIAPPITATETTQGISPYEPKIRTMADVKAKLEEKKAPQIAEVTPVIPDEPIKPAGVVEGKQPWEMTKEEFERQKYGVNKWGNIKDINDIADDVALLKRQNSETIAETNFHVMNKIGDVFDMPDLSSADLANEILRKFVKEKYGIHAGDIHNPAIMNHLTFADMSKAIKDDPFTFRKVINEVLTKHNKTMEMLDNIESEWAQERNNASNRLKYLTEHVGESIEEIGINVEKRILDKAFNEHKKIIQQALSEGKPIPSNVLEEYKGEPWADEALKGKGTESKGKITITYQRGGQESNIEIGGTFVGDKFIGKDKSSLAYPGAETTYGIYDKNGNMIKGGFDKASEAIEYAKQGGGTGGKPLNEALQTFQAVKDNPTEANIDTLVKIARGYTSKTNVPIPKSQQTKGYGKTRTEITGWRNFAEAIGEIPGKPDPMWKEVFGVTSAKDFVEMVHKIPGVSTELDLTDFISEDELLAQEAQTQKEIDNETTRVLTEGIADEGTIGEIERIVQEEISTATDEEVVQEVTGKKRLSVEELRAKLKPQKPVQGMLGETEQIFNLSEQRKEGEKLKGRILTKQEEEEALAAKKAEDELNKKAELFPIETAKFLTVTDKQTVTDINGKEVSLSPDEPFYRIERNEDGTVTLIDGKEVTTTLKELKDIQGTFSNEPNPAAGGLTPTMRAKREISDFQQTQMAFDPKTFDFSKEGFKAIVDSLYTKFVYGQAPLIDFIREKAGDEAAEKAAQRLRKSFRYKSAIDEMLKGKGVVRYGFEDERESKFIEDSKSLTDILKPLKNHQMYIDYEAWRAARTFVALDEYRPDYKMPEGLADKARDEIARIETKYADQMDVLRQVDKDHRQFEQDAILKPLVDIGWMSQKAFDTIVNAPEAEYYSSLQRQMDEQIGSYFKGKEPVKRRTGTEEELKVIPSVESTISNLVKAMKIVETQKSNKHIVGLRELYPDLAEIMQEKKPKWIKAEHEVKTEVDPVMRNELTSIAEKLGASVETLINIGRNKLGLFEYELQGLDNEEIARIKLMFGSSEQTFAHELGHFLDKKYNLISQFVKGTQTYPEIKRELRKIADQRASEEASEYYKKYVRKLPEQVAEFVSRYLTQPEQAKQLAPNAVRKFEAFLYSHSELKDLLNLRPSGQSALSKMSETIYVRSPIPPKNTIVVGENGVKHYYTAPEDVRKALDIYSSKEVGTITKVLSWPAKWLRAGATTTFDFILRNPVRDQFTAMVYAKYGYTPGVDFVKGLFHVLDKTDLYHEARAMGLGENFTFSMDRIGINTEARDLLSYRGAKGLKILNPLQTLRYISGMAEIGTRMGVYARARKAGAAPLEAISETSEATTDFLRFGAEGRAISMITAFWNPNVQGVDLMRRKVFNKANAGQSLLRIGLGITLPSMILWAINHDDERYKELPGWQKDLFWIINVGKDKPLIRIPKPFELGILFGSLPERMLSFMFDRDPRGMKEVATSIKEGAMPGLIPTAVLPVLEWMTNYNFFTDRPLENATHQNLPAGMRVGPNTTGLSEKIGKLVDISPIKLDNMIQGWTGGLGKETSALISYIMKDETPEVEKKWYEQAPGLKGFLAREPIGSTSESVNNFYDIYEKTQQAEKGYKLLAKSGDSMGASKYYKGHKKDIAMAKSARLVAEQLSMLRKQVLVIQDNKTMGSGTKRVRIDMLKKRMTEITKNYDIVYNRQKGR